MGETGNHLGEIGTKIETAKSHRSENHIIVRVVRNEVVARAVTAAVRAREAAAAEAEGIARKNEAVKERRRKRRVAEAEDRRKRKVRGKRTLNEQRRQRKQQRKILQEMIQRLRLTRSNLPPQRKTKKTITAKKNTQKKRQMKKEERKLALLQERTPQNMRVERAIERERTKRSGKARKSEENTLPRITVEVATVAADIPAAKRANAEKKKEQRFSPLFLRCSYCVFSCNNPFIATIIIFSCTENLFFPLTPRECGAREKSNKKQNNMALGANKPIVQQKNNYLFIISPPPVVLHMSRCFNKSETHTHHAR